MLKSWLVWRYFRKSSGFVSTTSFFSVFGIAIGVCALVITMSVVNGFIKTIHNSVIDYTGHVFLIQRGGVKDLPELQKKIKETLPNLQYQTPFSYSDALISADGKIYGALLKAQATDSYAAKTLSHRMAEGEFQLNENEVILGKAWQEKLGVKKGDKIKIIISKANPTSTYQLSPQIQDFSIKGFIDLGKYDYNERLAYIPPKDFHQLVTKQNGRASGLMLWLDSNEREAAEMAVLTLSEKLGVDYVIRDWYSLNRNFLSAVNYEKSILFFVLSIMILAACFNVSSSLYIAVLRRYRDISILRSMGTSRKFIQQVFSVQGLWLGIIGLTLGILLGLLLCWLVQVLPFFKIPQEIYKIDHIPVEVHAVDILAIIVFTIIVTYLSTLLPARRGAKMASVKGLTYE